VTLRLRVSVDAMRVFITHSYEVVGARASCFESFSRHIVKSLQPTTMTFTPSTLAIEARSGLSRSNLDLCVMTDGREREVERNAMAMIDAAMTAISDSTVMVRKH
jgi:hypothetical protein